MTFVDGNAIGGLLAEVLGVEATAARAVCAACGRRGVVAEVRVWFAGPGVVARCPACDSVLIRVATIRDRACVDLGGLAELELPV